MCACGGGVRTRNLCVCGEGGENKKFVCVWGGRTRNVCVCGGGKNKKCVCVCGEGGKNIYKTNNL